MLRPYYCSVHFRLELFLRKKLYSPLISERRHDWEKFLSLRPKTNKNSKGGGGNCVADERCADVKRLEQK